MRKETHAVKTGNIDIGGGSRITVQTMWKEPLFPMDLDKILDRIRGLSMLGCDILRFSVPDTASAEALGLLASQTEMPLVADIHFDWRLALRCMDFPVAKIRVNPGNLGAKWKLKEVAEKAEGKGIPIRIGVNSGSLPKDLEQKDGLAEALVEAAEREVAALDDMGFNAVIVSMKASNVDDTIQANRIFSARHRIPLHIGVTEAGPIVTGTARSAIAVHALLSEGIGDTVRISLSSPMDDEVLAGREILGIATGQRESASLVSCPRCGRAGFDTHAFTERWRKRIYSVKKPVTIAVMGCVVNGPGEGKHADLGICGAGDQVLIFKHGEIIHRCKPEDADTLFEEELSRL